MVVVEVLAAGMASTHRRRAELLRWAQHRPGVDWPGQAMTEGLRRRWCALEEAARACESAARIAEAVEPW